MKFGSHPARVRTNRALARALDVSEAAVRKARRDGRLSDPGVDGRDVAAARRLWKANTLAHIVGEDNAPKTSGSERTIDLAPFIVEVLKGEKPLHVQPDDFVFLNTNGRPIDVKVFTQWTWNPALRRLNIRPRKFYATRHTFIALALTRGWNLKALAEYCGTSIAMIEKHYGRYLGGDMRTQLALLMGRSRNPSRNLSTPVAQERESEKEFERRGRDSNPR